MGRGVGMVVVVVALGWAGAAEAQGAGATEARAGAPAEAPAVGPSRSEARATALREAAQLHLREGRIEEAFGALHEAAPQTADPAVWRELAEVAALLRMDDTAVEAYERYLALTPNAADRRAVEGRLRVLRAVSSGQRFAAPAPRALVDWEGRAVPVPRPRQLITLADWEGTLRPRPRPPRPTLVPFPVADESGDGGLGRRLSPP